MSGPGTSDADPHPHSLPRPQHDPSGDDRSDAELLTAHVAGDPEAFALLVARHRDRLWAVALRTSGNPEDAADALQDALVSAFRRAGTFGGRSSVTTWLHRVVVNACLDRIRHLKVRAAQPLPEDVDRMVPTATGSHADTEDPAETAVRSEQRRRVLAALAQLPAEHRAALVLVDMEGYGVAEAAEVLGCPVGTVKSRCARGRAKLRALLRDADAGPPGAGPAPPARSRGPGNPAVAPDVPPSVAPAPAPHPSPPPEGGAPP